MPATGSLAHSVQQAAQLIAAVLDGGNLTAAYERLTARHPEWPDASRGAVRDLAWSTLREYGRGDAILGRLMRSPPPPVVRAILLVGLHRLMQRPEQAYTIVDQCVEATAATMPGLKATVNGVLRNALRQREAWQGWIEASEPARHAHPQWWIDLLRRSQPQRWAEVLAVGNLHPPMSVRVNRRRIDVEVAQAKLAGAGIETRRLDDDALLLARPVGVGQLPGFAEGELSVQDAGAQRAAVLLDARDGERVLDACAAPGGKTAHLLERNELELLALEQDPERAPRIVRNLERLGLSARVEVADCCALDDWWDGRPFDRILADVPCSASGVVRRHPDIKWLRRPEDIAAFAATQSRILDALWRTLAPGGTMLYVTCSVFDAENAAQIARFCERHSDAQRLAIDDRPDCQLLPSAEHDGFYFARLRKFR